MKLLDVSRGVSIAALLAAAAVQPALAQDDEQDGMPNLEAIDMLFGDQSVTGGEDDGADAEGDAAPTAQDQMDAAAEEAEGTDEPRISDLTRALAGYEGCAIAAGAGLIDQGFSPEQAGEESLLACSGPRAAYVNAFYFELLPRYPGAEEGDVRASAERLTRQTDVAVAALVVREAPNYQPPESDEPTAEDEEETGE